MQFGPRSVAPSSRARRASRSVVGFAASPASAPTPGTTNTRTPVAAASSNAASTRSWLTMRNAHAGTSGSSATLG